MSILKEPAPSKFFLSVIYKDEEFFYKAERLIADEICGVDFYSDKYPFNMTDYYSSEMGDNLVRRFIVLHSLLPREKLMEIKLITCKIEERFMKNNKRRLNIDPGYMSLENVILATGKNYTHRIYLGNGVFADLTLIYQKGGFKSLAWTYPDYASERIIEFFNLLRSKYVKELRSLL